MKEGAFKAIVVIEDGQLALEVHYQHCTWTLRPERTEYDLKESMDLALTVIEKHFARFCEEDPQGS
jgi:hypothetical protein